MNFDSWQVDLSSYSATHECGFRIEIEGSPSSPSAVNPGPFPKHLSALEQVRLLRTGVEAIADAAKQKKASRPSVRKPLLKRKENPDRPTLSLKKK